MQVVCRSIEFAESQKVPSKKVELRIGRQERKLIKNLKRYNLAAFFNINNLV